jgi:hypothetical protein
MAKEAAGEVEEQKIVPVSRNMIKDGILEQAQAAAANFKLPNLGGN